MLQGAEGFDDQLGTVASPVALTVKGEVVVVRVLRVALEMAAHKVAAFMVDPRHLPGGFVAAQAKGTRRRGNSLLERGHQADPEGCLSRQDMCGTAAHHDTSAV